MLNFRDNMEWQFNFFFNLKKIPKAVKKKQKYKVKIIKQ